MRAQHLAQGLVHQVRRAVVAHRVGTLHGIHPGREGVAYLDLTFHHAAVVAKHRRLDLQGVFHHHARAAVAQFTGIPRLATALGVEGCVVQHHHHVLAGARLLYGGTIHIQGRDFAGLAHQVLVAVEGGVHAAVLQALLHLELARRACLFALALHGRIEAGLIHLHTTFAAHIGRQVQGEAIGVVQLEGGFAVQHRHAAGGARSPGRATQCPVKDLHPVGDGLEETLFLLTQHIGHSRRGAAQFRVGLTHGLVQGRHQLVEEGLARTELVAVANGAACDPAQHIATPFITWNYPIDDGEGAGADVVGNHLERRRLGVAAARRGGRRGRVDGGLRGLEQVHEGVDLVVAVHVLQHRGDALQAHASVHAGLGQGVHHTVFGAVELHEDVVPDLNVAVTVFIGAARWATRDVGPVIKEDLGAGAAGARVTHHPEVVGGVAGTLVVTDAHDALGRHADLLVPDLVGLVVLGVNRHPQLVLGQLEHLGEQFPGVADGVLLEVVAKAEIAQHLEEGVVTCGVAHVLQIVVLAAGTDALLRRGGARVGPLVKAQEHVLELVHARIGEQQRGVVTRHHGAGGHDGVSLGLKELQEGVADFSGVHARA